MEVGSIVVLVASGLKVVTKTIKDLNDLTYKYQNVQQSTQLLIAKLSTLRAALSQLQDLLQPSNAVRFTTPQIESDLLAAIHPCVLIIGILDQHVTALKSGWLDGGVRYLWDESIIKEHGGHLDSQILALNLLLQVTQLSSANEQRVLLERRRSRRILRQARDDASSYLTGSSNSPSPADIARKFDFDSQLIDSNAYRVAFLKWSGNRRHTRTVDPFLERTSKQMETSVKENASLEEGSNGIQSSISGPVGDFGTRTDTPGNVNSSLDWSKHALQAKAAVPSINNTSIQTESDTGERVSMQRSSDIENTQSLGVGNTTTLSHTRDVETESLSTVDVESQKKPSTSTSRWHLSKPTLPFTAESRQRPRRKQIIITVLAIFFLITLAISLSVGITQYQAKSRPASTNAERPAMTPTVWIALNMQNSESGCVAPGVVWSCSHPIANQGSNTPPNLLDFTYKISSKTGNSVVADPPLPDIRDQLFIGNTTDNHAAPYEGEETGLLISLFEPSDSGTSLSKRQLRGEGRASTPPATATNTIPSIFASTPAPNSLSPSSTTTSTSNSATPTSSAPNQIPPLELLPNGTVAPTVLIPYPQNQALRLYNPGTKDEHYGFYVYYNKSLFINSMTRTAILSNTSAEVEQSEASLRITWTSTRFRVQIWTSGDRLSESATKPLTSYSWTVLVDRHGSTATKKMVYAYNIKEPEPNAAKNKSFIFEDRTFGGTLVNPVSGLGQVVDGPVDGGTGGCFCKWSYTPAT